MIPECPKCDGEDVYVEGGELKGENDRVVVWHYKCRSCGHEFAEYVDD